MIFALLLMAGFKLDSFLIYPRPKSRYADSSLLPRFEASKMYGFPHQHQFKKKYLKIVKIIKVHSTRLP